MMQSRLERALTALAALLLLAAVAGMVYAVREVLREREGPTGRAVGESGPDVQDEASVRGPTTSPGRTPAGSTITVVDGLSDAGLAPFPASPPGERPDAQVQLAGDPPTSAATKAGGESRAEDGASNASASQDAASGETPDGAHAIEGLVRDGSGRPIEGAKALVWIPGGEPGSYFGKTEKTGVDGRFRVGTGEPGRYRLDVSADGFMDAELGPQPTDGPPLEVVLRRGGVVHGWVRAADGTVPADLEADLRKEEPASVAFLPGPGIDKRGAFRCTGLRPGHYVLLLRAPGWMPEEAAFDLGGDEDLGPLEIVLLRGGSIRGRVVEAGTGQPLAGARVKLQHRDIARMIADLNDPESGASSGEDGRFLLPGVEPGFHTLEVTHPSAAPLRVPDIEVVDGLVADAGDIAIQPTGRIQGRVIDGEDAPVAGASIGIESEGGGRVWIPGIESKVDGGFEIEGLPLGRFRLTARVGNAGDSSLLRMPLTVTVEVASGETARVLLRAGGGTRLDGRVLVAGVGVAGVVVKVRAYGHLGIMIEVYATTDPEGRFAVLDLAPGSYGLSVSLDGDRQTEIYRTVEVPAGVPALEVVLEPALGSLEARVLLAGGAPASGAELILEFDRDANHGPLRSNKHEAEAGSDGSVRFARILAGTYQVSLRYPGWILPAPVSVEVPQGGPAAVLELVLVPGASITGRVLDAAGNPLAGVRVAAGRHGVVSWWALEQSTVRTDAAGRWMVEGLEAGSYHLLFDGKGLAERRIGPVPVESPGNVAVNDVVLAEGGSLRVRIADGQGRPRKDVRLMAWPADESVADEAFNEGGYDAFRRQETNESGGAVWERLAAGAWRVYRVAEPRGPGDKRAPLHLGTTRIEAGSSATLELTLDEP